MGKEIKNIREIREEDFWACTNNREKILFLLRYAILAPSTHNSQPWLFKVKETSCTVCLNPNLYLPHNDPKNRYINISLGCAIENMIVAAKHFGVYRDFIPLTGSNEVGEIIFDFENIKPENKVDRLIDAIKIRLNARGFFTGEVPQSILQDIATKLAEEHYTSSNLNIDFITETDKIKQLAGLTAAGLRIAYKDPAFRREMSGWMRHSLTKQRDGMPGYSLKMPFLISFIFPWLVRNFNISSILAKLNLLSAGSAKLFCVITADQDDQKTCVAAGRLAERVILELNSHSIKTSVFVASIEVPETADQVKNIIGTSKEPIFLFVGGKMSAKMKYNQRIPAEEKIIN